MRFPKMHIAESVVNRIMNAAGAIPMPNIAAQGAAIDAAVRAPAAAVAPPAGSEPAMLAASLEGDSAASEAVAAQILS